MKTEKKEAKIKSTNPKCRCGQTLKNCLFLKISKIGDGR